MRTGKSLSEIFASTGGREVVNDMVFSYFLNFRNRDGKTIKKTLVPIIDALYENSCGRKSWRTLWLIEESQDMYKAFYYKVCKKMWCASNKYDTSNHIIRLIIIFSFYCW